MQDADEGAVAAARAGHAPDDARLGVLYCFARELVARRGHINQTEVRALMNAGYSHAAVLEVVAQVGCTTLANLTYNISDVPLDPAFEPQAWARAAA
jgi:alkylhydroperoxidase family enzyme